MSNYTQSEHTNGSKHHFEKATCETITATFGDYIDEPRWVCWKIQSKRKVPVNPNTGASASHSDSKTWSDYQVARDYCFTHKDIYGIGIVFANNNPSLTRLTGIDLDQCFRHEELIPEVLEIVEKVNTYTELSPSGKGLHVYVKGAKLLGDKCKRSLGRKCKSNIEIYDQRRYFTVTGRVLDGLPLSIEPRQAELDELYKSFFGDSEESATSDKTSSKKIARSETLTTVSFSDLSTAERNQLVDALRNPKIRDTIRRKNPGDLSGSDFALGKELRKLNIDDPNMLAMALSMEGSKYARDKNETYLERLVNEVMSADLRPPGEWYSDIQRGRAYRSHDARRWNSRSTINRSIRKLEKEGKEISRSAIAERSGYAKDTVSKYVKLRPNSVKLMREARDQLRENGEKLTQKKVAEITGLSERTVREHWKKVVRRRGK